MHCFSNLDIPTKAISDNGPKFIDKACKRFSEQCDLKHISSSPHYPKGNGQTEHTIQTSKRNLKKTV